MLRRTFLMSSAALPLAAPAFAQANPMMVRELYERDGSLTQWALDNEGRRVRFRGFMAPPLKAEAQFFVLTQRPMAVCPFCETAAEWPDDIMAIYTKRVVDPVYYTVGIEVEGVLEIGEYRDPDTGFLSLVRLSDATYG
ncbi:hypothetical protein [Histidinibacterium lentulum]|uniref:DUF3299 domain-containing protein n=1 Tax=Histidinibacterium lentulum TaxID=2480588 RepID=A0A3N2R605_9RHOB|nr:hypothetical protein [Histidinibacterium lentulum]ROU02925.1 hypothetical protein EAT49_06395 [Histidinibacterium lentulum]